MNKKFYITTTLPYVNAEPHIGFALEIVQADVIARYHKEILGEEVLFNTGTDEHGQKIYEAAKKESKEPQAYTDEYAAKFDALKQALNLSYTNFIRTTAKHHLAAAQEFWQRCNKNGDIYKKLYKVKYCVGCELAKTDSELAEGKCPVHPNLNLEQREEENYFFRFSKYQKKLQELYKKNKDFVVPQKRFNEIINFVKGDLQDFSISRLKAKMPWGVPVPNDEEQVMYVWFDALINYISTLGWPNDEKKFKAFWPGLQVAGKDNLRQQSAMWQAMLMSAGLPCSRQILIHGFITNEGQKMSKSLGNVIDPLQLVKDYGTDAVRYYLLKYLQPFEDSDFSMASFKEVYNSDLANGLGNLVARVSNLIEQSGLIIKNNNDLKYDDVYRKKAEILDQHIVEYRFDMAISFINNSVTKCNRDIDMDKPWKRTDEKELEGLFSQYVYDIMSIANWLKPFLPDTAEKIIKQFTAEKIVKGESLFPRI